jgi:hypothetical protein
VKAAAAATLAVVVAAAVRGWLKSSREQSEEVMMGTEAQTQQRTMEVQRK